MKHRMMGFTLVELSLVLLALGLVIPAAVIFWQLSERQRVTSVQTDVQQQARDAVVGFLHSNYRLPCPAVNAQGVEDCAGTRQVGFVPWRTLNLPRPEAGLLRYGVSRDPSVTPHLDRDLAVAKDRMNPLRVPTPNPRTGAAPNPPTNNNAPNPNLPQLPVPAEGVLGATFSGKVGDPSLAAEDPLNANCLPDNVSPTAACPPTAGGTQAVNLIDVCLALNTASDAVSTVSTRLGVNARLAGTTAKRAVAFVIVAPGLLDADGINGAFDGANSTASDSAPTFEAPGTAVTDTYDDIVMAASPTELFAELHCGAALSGASHAHFNAATGALVLERAMYDYRDQLYVAVVLGEADVASAKAGVASAAASVLDAGKETLAAMADATGSAGARSFQLAPALFGAGLAAASVIVAAIALDDAQKSLAEARQVHTDFATRTSAMTALAQAVNLNALRADAIGH